MSNIGMSSVSSLQMQTKSQYCFAQLLYQFVCSAPKSAVAYKHYGMGYFWRMHIAMLCD